MPKSAWVDQRPSGRRGLLVWVGAALLAALLLAGGKLLLGAFPERVEIGSAGSFATIRLDGATHIVGLAAPLRSVRLVPVPPYQREYQLDGSDSTNNGTLDPAYFARFAASPYYRFQALLRDEASYSRWVHLQVREGSGQVAVSRPDPPDGVLFDLPDPFQLTLELQRLETPRTLEFLDQAGGTLSLTIDRNGRYARVTEAPAGGPAREVARWFFPTDWRPPAAGLTYLATRVAALALALICALTLLAAIMPGRDWPGPGRRVARVVPVLAAAAALGGGGYAAVALFDRAPHILDAVSYYFQARVFAGGTLAAPAPAVKEAFPTPFTVVHAGQWFSQYPPGAPLVLAVGMAAGLPWLVEPLLAAAATLLIFAIGKRQYGTRTALLAAVLASSSPFLYLQAGSFLSHVPAMLFAAGFLYAATRFIEAPARRWAWIGGASLGLCFLTREVAAVLYALPVGAYLAVRCHRHPRWLSTLAPGALALAGAGLVYLLYNLAQTGSPLLPPRALFNGADRLGFGPGIGFYGQHTVAAGLVNTDELLTSLTFTLFGWPFAFSLALILLPLVAALCSVSHHSSDKGEKGEVGTPHTPAGGSAPCTPVPLLPPPVCTPLYRWWKRARGEGAGTSNGRPEVPPLHPRVGAGDLAGAGDGHQPGGAALTAGFQPAASPLPSAPAGAAFSWDLLHGSVFGLFVLAYLAYFYHGIALGPRYYFEALPALVLLTARGFAVLAAASAAILQALGRRSARARARRAALGLAAVLLATNVLYFIPRQLEIYRGFSGLPGGGGPALAGFVQREVTGRAPSLKNALVTTSDWWLYSVYFAAMNCPRLDCNTVFALVPGEETRERLAAAFPGRTWYVIENEDGMLTAVPVAPP